MYGNGALFDQYEPAQLALRVNPKHRATYVRILSLVSVSCHPSSNIVTSQVSSLYVLVKPEVIVLRSYVHYNQITATSCFSVVNGSAF